MGVQAISPVDPCLPVEGTIRKRFKIINTYTTRQFELHQQIDRAISFMRSPIVYSPQIIAGRMHDVSCAIRGIGRFLNPTSSRWIFKHDDCKYVIDTLQKLTAMKVALIKFYHLKFDEDDDKMDYDEYTELHFYMDAAIAYIKSVGIPKM